MSCVLVRSSGVPHETLHDDTSQRTLLSIERLRTFTVLAFIVALVLACFIRIIVSNSTGHWHVVGALLVLILVESGVLLRITHAEHSHQPLPPSTLVVSILAEIAVPAFCIAFLSNPTVPLHYRPLANPWVLVLFPLVAVSTLRLTPILSWLAGATAAGFYLCASYYHGWRPELITPSHLSHTQIAVEFYALILLAAGFVAGAIAGQIRKYVRALMTETSARQKVERELEIARTIQRSLLPLTHPDVKGFDIAGWNWSAEATGGDFFYWQQAPDGRFMITLADVTGHGIGPALLASVCRAYFRACLEYGGPMTVIMQRLNRLLAADFMPPHFVTLVAVACQEQDGSVELFSAGQGPLLAYSARRGQTTELQSHTIPFGLMPCIPIVDSSTLKIEVGDVLLLVTDGFVEWTNAHDEEFGSARVRQSLERTYQSPAEAIIRELYRCVLEFTGGTPQPDDLTAVVIKRVPIHQEAHVPRSDSQSDLLTPSSVARLS